jgi:hypothetical protein
MPRILVALGLALAAGTVGCAVVKPSQREILSERAMRPESETLEDHFRQHWQESREGAFGGYAAAGGGCGCN